MTVQKLKGTIKEIAGILYLFTSLVCLCVIGLHFIEQVDTEFQDFARVVEIIKNDPLAFLRGGEGYEPSDFLNFKIIATWLLQF
jgi:hypothetical protein